MEIFLHHIYEYKKGLRRLVLHTTASLYREFIEAKLSSQGISYIIVPVSGIKINVFFGDPYCIEILRSFAHNDLSTLSDEQDFILGSMLGYDIVQQCKRFLKRKEEYTIKERTWANSNNSRLKMVNTYAN
ncbi:DUF2023 family protein [Chitinispirillales bacterium ANBcel5]|uniref:DUF2023 family protein n=1 Tax=Cellulosispirillum alkaliphilum TaxID=3039283 RepID=UPI002A53D40D|nr:DUF2023 family protein [Chitinispirillales bacterium ANBcel5]